MKLTDLALVFVVILLPIVIIVYVNTSFVIRAEREEMYYKNMITSAVNDATNAMKLVENDDVNIDYGYSGILDNKVSVNARVAVDTFFTSMYNNLGINGNANSEMSLKSYIPALAVIDYDGVYVYSAEEVGDNIEFTLKPKKYFTYTYFINTATTATDQMKEFALYDETNDIIHANLLYEVTFTQDDHIFLKVYQIDGSNNIYDIRTTRKDAGGNIVFQGIDFITEFYLTDEVNNTWLVGDVYNLHNLGGTITSSEIQDIKGNVVALLKEKRKEIIAKICMEEISYAVNVHNYYARRMGISYDFNFNISSDSDWYDTVDGIGVVAIVQGISLGNRNLHYSAYSVSSLTSAKKYYLSDEMVDLKDDAVLEGVNVSDLKKHRYYHASEYCPIYKAYLDYIGMLNLGTISPSFMYDREEAAANNFKPCFICKP